MIEQKHKFEVTNTRTHHSADCDTNHSLVFSTTILGPRPYHHQTTPSKKIDMNIAHLSKLKKEYYQKLEEQFSKLPDIPEHGPCWTDLRATTHSTVLETFGRRNKIVIDAMN